MFSDILNTLYHIRNLTFSCGIAQFYRPQSGQGTTYDILTIVLRCRYTRDMSAMTIIVISGLDSFDRASYGMVYFSGSLKLWRKGN
jgi:hypothetical protein